MKADLLPHPKAVEEAAPAQVKLKAVVQMPTQVRLRPLLHPLPEVDKL
jgi:hypothetical protein